MVGNFVGTVSDENPNILVPYNQNWKTNQPERMPWNIYIDGYSDKRFSYYRITKDAALSQVYLQLEYLRKIYELSRPVGIKAALAPSAFMR